VSNRWLILGIIFLTRLSMGFQFQSVASVAPFLVDDFHIGYGQVGVLMGLYLLPGGVIALPGGMLGQRFGERRLVLIGLALMAAGGLGMAASESFAAASAGRIVSGIGGVLLNVLLAKMVADWFRDKEMATAMGVMLTSWPIGMGLALATLGTLAAVSSWRGAVHATVAAAAVAFVLMLLFYRDPPAARSESTGPSILGLAPRELALATIGGLGWGVFNASYVVFLSFAPALLAVGGRSVGAAGAIVSLGIWVTLGSIPLGGLLADRLGRPGLLIGAGSVSVALAMLAFPYFDRPALWCVLVGILAGAAPGALMALLPKALPQPALAPGFGVYYTVFYLSMAAMPGVAGGLRDRYESPAAPLFFAAALMAAVVLALVAFRAVERASPSTRI
jgi:predicted MFS family arabinose efflux permease